MKKVVKYSAFGIILAAGVLFVLFIIALRQGPSIGALSGRVCQSIMVNPSRLSYIGGNNGRDPSVFFMLSGEIPAEADVRILKGWARVHNEERFNNLAKTYQVPFAVNDRAELLNYKGEGFDLYLVKAPEGYCVLYDGF